MSTSSMYLLAAICVIAPGCGDNVMSTDDDSAPDASTTAPDAEVAQPGLRLFDYVLAIAVTPDGRTALFQNLTSEEAVMVLVDTATGEVLDEVSLGDPSRVLATSISATGRVTAMHADPLVAGAWTHDGGWVDLGNPFPAGCDADLSSAWDISDDGSVVVGLGWDGCAPQAFRWTDASGSGVFTLLDRIGQAPADVQRPPTNRATVVSADGTITAGFAEGPFTDRLPARWDADGTGEVLVPLDGDAPGEIYAISADGSRLAGGLGVEGFTWTEADGIVTLPRLDAALPSDPVFPLAMTADGSAIFGGVGNAFFGTPIAFAYRAADGIRPLADVVTAAGIELPDGLALTSVTGASADGTVLVGVAIDADFAQKVFVLRLPAAP